MNGSIPLEREDVRRSLEGYIPATLASCSADGVPNVIHLSQVHYVDEKHVALSRQFFNKTARNIAENPQVTVVLIDPLTYQHFSLRGRFVRSETAGATFDRLKQAVDTIAAMSGMKDVFELKAADVYEVISLHEVAAYTHKPGREVEPSSS